MNDRGRILARKNFSGLDARCEQYVEQIEKVLNDGTIIFFYRSIFKNSVPSWMSNCASFATQIVS